MKSSDATLRVILNMMHFSFHYAIFYYSSWNIKGLSCRGEDLRWLGEGSETEREGTGVLGGGNWGPRGREVGEKGEGSGDWVPPCPHPQLV